MLKNFCFCKKDGNFATDNDIFFVKCVSAHNADKIFTVNHHLKTDKYIRAVNRLKTNSVENIQSLVSNIICEERSVFKKYLCKAILFENSSLHTLNNKT